MLCAPCLAPCTSCVPFSFCCFQSLEGKIAAHFSEAAGLFARQREEAEANVPKRPTAETAAEEVPPAPVPGCQRNPLVPPPSMDSLESGGPSRWVR